MAIHEGRLKPNDRLPTLHRLAGQYHVSYMTARQAVKSLESKGMVSPRKGNGTFVNDRSLIHRKAGPATAKGRVLVVGLGASDLDESQYPMNWEQNFHRYLGISEMAQKMDLQVVCSREPGSPPSAEDLLKQHEHVIGFLVNATSFSDQFILQAVRKSIPTVAMNRRMLPICSEVQVDILKGMVEMVGHLCRLNRRRIALLINTEQDGWRHNIRYLYFREALAAHGLRAEESRVILDSRAALDLLRGPSPCNALLCGNDFLAIEAMRALREDGHHVPNDISVVGIDDVAAAARAKPSLTTLRQPFYELGAEALRLLLELLDKPRHEVIIRKIDSQLIIRDSCGGRQSSGAQP
jgi:DNA-binding LacI/PurR family transcriptional regulator/DNA-binding transcriptional regulator YhcF (GntR family)